MTSARQRCPDVAFIDGSQTVQLKSRISAVMLIVEDSTVTVKCRTAMNALFLYFSLCLSVIKEYF